ncbi:MAG TPA: polymer-forming cytoskeletal protein [Candidatus Methylomirabilis sp.]|nr:polymer-forming cytoskeletal protein [Candidatus Methylomirabilis sp.]
MGHSGDDKDIQVVFDRRQGERRQRVLAVEQERRQEERRDPLSSAVPEIDSFLGEGTRWKGELSFTGAVRVDGHMEGMVIRGEALIIGEGGFVSGEIEVEVLQVRGQVQGKITARKRVELLESSRVTSTIRAPSLVIWKGATFDGQCEMPSLQANP